MIAKAYRKPCGFTLVESLVVMFTIILLASILIPGLMGRGGRAPEQPSPEPAIEKKSAKELSAPLTANGSREAEAVQPESPAPLGE